MLHGVCPSYGMFMLGRLHSTSILVDMGILRLLWYLQYIWFYNPGCLPSHGKVREFRLKVMEVKLKIREFTEEVMETENC